MADCVKVAVRVRPLVPSEISKGSQDIIEILEKNQVYIRSIDRYFTFNYTLDKSLSQTEVYEECVKNMIDNLFLGYNVTILAYGQTGSGKTHTMGTSYNGSSANDYGIIPSAVKQIFSYVRDNFTYDFTISVSFIELYQESLYDLLSENKNKEQCVLDIREDIAKGIHIPGLTEVPVSSGDDVLQALTRGSSGRATASTNMNSQSSRSHAVFTVNILMQNKENAMDNKSAKLHLVDLAGSERQKKTGAVGVTFKEGVNINKGLLALGNVISCLGDENKQGGFVPYRDSNLTRLLKDSLGGNSKTLMIACISPADYNLEETMSTLRYADRARKIKNKPIVNEDPKAAEINQLKKEIRELKLQIIDGGGVNGICPAELELMKKENHELRVKVRDLTMKLSMALQDNTISIEKFLILQSANEQLQKNINELKVDYDGLLNAISDLPEDANVEEIKSKLSKFHDIQAKFQCIAVEQEKIEQEIRNHEDNSHSSGSINNSLDLTGEMDEKHESHAAKQVEMTTQLKEISNMLLLKERLAQQLSNNIQNMAECTMIAESESKIAALEKERNDLLQQLKAFQEGKLAENRRKRLQELEGQIQELRKKIVGQDRLLKMKESDIKRIDTLKKEILQMKQARVKLVKSMREDSEKFRQWKLKRERELAKLKQEDRKKQLQITQMKAMNTKQQNITKRKIEEAAALSKRLRDIMSLKKQVQDTKNMGRGEKNGAWLKQEFEVFVGITEAKATLKGLLEDRAVLQEQLEYMQSKPEFEGSTEMKQLQEDIDMRTVQIQDLQQKVLDSDDDGKKRSRFDNIQTMGEAKHALKTIFEQTGEFIKKSVQDKLKVHELQDNNTELKAKIEATEKQIKQIKEEHKKYVEEMEKKCEDRIAVLFEQFKSEECKNCEELKEKMNSIKNLQKLLPPQSKTPPENVSIKKKIVNENRKVNQNETFNIEDIIDDSDVDDRENDPDWRKTPLGKRILNEKHKHLKMPVNLFGDSMSRKRSSEGGCTCKTNCSKRCGCRKFARICTESCKCRSDVCANRTDGNVSNDNDGVTSSDDSFKKPKLVINDDKKEREERRLKNRN